MGFPFATMAGSQIGQPILQEHRRLWCHLGPDGVRRCHDPLGDRGAVQTPSAEALEKNLKALDLGRKAAGETAEAPNRWHVADGDAHDQVMTIGNQAVALGFVVGGGRFFAGYPITPATEIMEYLMRYLPPFHGVVRQAEDELAAVNMIIGAAYAGARVMTSTSGPAYR